MLLEAGLYARSTSGFAQRASLRFSDMILAVNDVGVSGISDLDRALESIRQGGIVALLIRRGSITTFVPGAPPFAVSHAERFEQVDENDETGKDALACCSRREPGRPVYLRVVLEVA